MTFFKTINKSSILWLHKWVGLFVGLIIFILGITGCIYVFYDDLKTIIYPDRYIIQDKVSDDAKVLPFTELIKIANDHLPNQEKVSRADLSLDKTRTWIFRAIELDKDKMFYHQNLVYYKRVFMNPYTGKVQFVEDTKSEFFSVTLAIHRTLLMGRKVGTTIISVSTILFIVLIISGLILWFPKKLKKKLFKKAIWVDFSVRWKRLVYDLHNVIGFQTFAFTLIIAYTGLIFSFPNFEKSTTKFFNFIDFSSIDKNSADEEVNFTVDPTNLLNESLIHAVSENPNADMISIRMKGRDGKKEKEHRIVVRTEKGKRSYFYRYAFDLENGKLVSKKSSNNQPFGDQLANMNYDLHTGSIMGYPTKILAFIVSFIVASMPVTGTIMWVNKNSKKWKRKTKA